MRTGNPPASDHEGCLYQGLKGYRYWARSLEGQTLRPDILNGKSPCPFGGGLWQLWVNHTLAHAIAKLEGRQEACFTVCAPRGNVELHQGGAVMGDFKAVLANPDTARMIYLEDLLDA